MVAVGVVVAASSWPVVVTTVVMRKMMVGPARCSWNCRQGLDSGIATEMGIAMGTGIGFVALSIGREDGSVAVFVSRVPGALASCWEAFVPGLGSWDRWSGDRLCTSGTGAGTGEAQCWMGFQSHMWYSA